jgi:ABC-type transporter MlaC component
MKLRILLFLLVLNFSVGAVGAQNQTNWNKDERELTALVKQMTDAQVNYDRAALDKIFAADYIEISPVGEFDPREKVLGFYSPEVKAKAGDAKAAVEASDFSIRVYEKQNFAIVITRLTFLRAPALPPINMRATVVCRRDKGVWKIASVQYTGIRPSQPVQPAKTE